MEAARRPRIVVVGSYAVGLVMRTTRIPLRGETVLGHDFQRMDGGKGSNQAIACARLGAHTTFLAAVGDDATGDAAIGLLLSEGVDTSYMHRMAGTPTGVGFITVDDNGENAIAVDLGANRLLTPDHIDLAEDVISQADILLAQLEIPPETALYAIRMARRYGVRTILNPAPAQPLSKEALSAVDLLTPNGAEARTLTGSTSVDPKELAAILRGSGVASVVLTMGERGAWIGGGPDGRAVPAFPVTAVDTTGAGDAFNAALAVALAEGGSIQSAVVYACAAGAYCVQSLGTVPSYADRAQLDAFLASAANG